MVGGSGGESLRRIDAKDHVRHLKQDGWSVVEGVIPESQVDAVKQEVQRATQAHQNPSIARESGVGHVGGFINFNQAIAPYLARRSILDPIEALLGPSVKISFTTATINLAKNPRTGWHADWPFNQNNAGHIAAPYADVPMHITTLWMLSAFSAANGGTLVVPGSHRSPNNPTGDNGVDPLEPYPTEMNVSGSAGSVLIMDSRTWHAAAPNQTEEPRVAVVVRYAPWWLDTRVLCPGSRQRQTLEAKTGLADPHQPTLPSEVFAALPEDVQPLFSHWVSG